MRTIYTTLIEKICYISNHLIGGQIILTIYLIQVGTDNKGLLPPGFCTAEIILVAFS